MSSVYEKLKKCYTSIRQKTNFIPQIALVLGSGLGDYAKNIRVTTIVDYHEIEDFPISTVSGHAGRFVFGYLGTVPIVCMQGRVHYYEGYSMTDVVLPIRLMKMLGAKVLFLTNAAGGIQDGMKAGDLMMLTGQISSFVPSPLIGENIEELGIRFPDMNGMYDVDFQKQIRACAQELHISLKEGTYIQFTGPAYETPQEVRMAKLLGADAVGMSTACEAVAARHMGMRILGISCITNMAAGITDTALSHEDVKKIADETAPKFEALVSNVIEKIGKELSKDDACSIYTS